MLSIATTSPRSLVASDVYRLVRRNLEWLVAAVVLLVIGFEREVIQQAFATQDWGIDRYYSAVFGWASIQGAFLFSVYAFFLSRSEPFIRAIAQTEAFHSLRQYVLRALWLSIGLTLLTLPLLVAAPEIKVTAKLTAGFGVFWLVSVWLTYTFMCFVKVIRVFRKLEAMQDNCG